MGLGLVFSIQNVVSDGIRYFDINFHLRRGKAWFMGGIAPLIGREYVVFFNIFSFISQFQLPGISKLRNHSSLY